MSNQPLPSSFDNDKEFYEENRWEKLSRRLKEEPLIPLGCLLTCMALVGATRSIRAGDHNRTNRMFRARIYAQGFTLAALVAGSMYWQSDRDKRKEFDKVVAERKAKEKTEAWIRELEARDQEDREYREAREAARRRAEAGIVEPKSKMTVKITGIASDAKSSSSSANLDASPGPVATGSEGGKGIMERVGDLLYGKK